MDIIAEISAQFKIMYENVFVFMYHKRWAKCFIINNIIL